MKKVSIFSLLLVFAGASLWAMPKNKKTSTCARSQSEYRKAFQDPKALEKQNYVIDLWKIKRVEDQKQLEEFSQLGELVGVVPSTSTYYIDPHFPERLRFLCLFARWFLDEVAEEFYLATQKQKVHTVVNRQTGQIKQIVRGKIKRLKIPSLVRDRPHQRELVKRLPKGQAASAEEGDKRQSSHLAGTTFDISTKDLSKTELCWLLDYLYEVQVIDLGISVIWESRSHILHIMVFPVPTLTDHIVE